MKTNYVAFFKEVAATDYTSLEQILDAVEQLKVILDKRWKLAPANDDYWFVINTFELYTHNRPLRSSSLLRIALLNVHRNIRSTYQTRESQLKVHVVRDVLNALNIWIRAIKLIAQKEQNMETKYVALVDNMPLEPFFSTDEGFYLWDSLELNLVLEGDVVFTLQMNDSVEYDEIKLIDPVTCAYTKNTEKYVVTGYCCINEVNYVFIKKIA